MRMKQQMMAAAAVRRSTKVSEAEVDESGQLGKGAGIPGIPGIVVFHRLSSGKVNRILVRSTRPPPLTSTVTCVVRLVLHGNLIAKRDGLLQVLVYAPGNG